ncbi:M13 family metallopeptidase [Undibacterium sp. 5I1]|uniref:M13 family metallopeptidase n=1 Tax=unclassified Undibacterium TaxID=2630295 RepID=UPI002AB55F63|nr:MULTISPECIES: M13 family metallopeptidase [unclassified Undibacterium]MDY7537186.1 M13 family metallopeptidase [Undibacterium sp. 5I1]MEB0231475.1 M13 family metallopeptidase [Undibacterium sp. 10I3]MEB0258982.1 M13 family metallopeptidase [Undibacterium sp. 5I1]
MKKTMTLRRSVLAILLCFSSAATIHAQSNSNNLVLEAQTMDLKSDPCTDFFEYANGTWLKTNTIPADRARYTAYDEVTERNLLALKGIAESASAKLADQSNSAVVNLIGAYYHSGIDEARIEADGAKSLAADLAQIDSITDRAQLLAVIAHQHQIGVGSLFNFYIDQDAKNTTRYIPQIVQGGLGLPDRDYYLKTDAKTLDIRQKYQSYIATMFGLLGDVPELAKQNAAAVIALETRLAKASMSKVDLRDPKASYHLMDVNGLSKLSKLDGSAKWANYFKDIGLVDPAQFNVGQPQFIAEAGRMLNTLPLPQWKTYLRWQLANANAKDLSSAFVNANFDFYGRTLAGTKELQPRWKRVLHNLDSNVGEALGELYVAQFFGPEAKAGVLEMVDNIKLAMRDSLAKADWMAASTKQQAYRKLDTIVVKIGYPDKWRDYSQLKVDPNSYAGNNMRAAEFEFKRNLAKFGKPIDRNEWGMTPQTVNAYYNPTMNEMVFPAGILQPPLYHIKADLAANYGNTGATIGHELTHAFDDEGRQFDADGNLKSWWTTSDEKAFLKRVAGIEKQFDEFNPIEKLHINGKLTAGENIADLGGDKIALQALRAALKNTPQAPEIDGLTPEQRYFIANAQSFRGKMRDESLRLQLATNPHAPEKYRVIGPIANMPEFAEAFSCPANRSPLRPEGKRVTIW